MAATSPGSGPPPLPAAGSGGGGVEPDPASGSPSPARAPWADRPVLSLDTETSGVDPFSDRIVEVAAVLIGPDGTPADPFAAIVDPGIEVPAGAAAVHGITTERARAEGLDPAVVLAHLACRVHDAAEADIPVVIYNAAFDLPLLVVEAARHRIAWPAHAHVLDPLVIDKALDRYRKGSRKLTAVAEHHGVELGDAAHGALADATASGQVLRRIVDAHPGVAAMDLDELWARQQEWARDQHDSFVDYMRRAKDPTFDKPGGWPIPAGRAAA